jgi:DnaJ family protein A protein 2
MSKNTELYDILELPVNCTTEDIKKMYKKKAVVLHPDKGGNKEQFQKLNEAYEILSNPDKRNQYDQTGSITNGGVNHHDIFSNMFQGFQGFNFQGFPGFNQKQKCQPTQVICDVTLNDLYNGVVKKVNYTRKNICINCNGKGAHKVNICNQCNGSGKKVFRTQLGPNMIQQQIIECNECNSTGNTFSEKDKCEQCKAHKIIKIQNIIDVEILPGMIDKQVITFENMGDDISNTVIPGDLIIVLNQEKHEKFEKFERQENNLLYKMNISLGEALLGFSKNIILLDYNQVVIKSSDGCIQPNSKWEIKDYGMPILNTNTKGNMIIEIIVQFPNSLSSTDKEIVQSLFNIKSPRDESDCSNETIIPLINNLL